MKFMTMGSVSNMRAIWRACIYGASVTRLRLSIRFACLGAAELDLPVGISAIALGLFVSTSSCGLPLHPTPARTRHSSQFSLSETRWAFALVHVVVVARPPNSALFLGSFDQVSWAVLVISHANCRVVSEPFEDFYALVAIFDAFTLTRESFFYSAPMRSVSVLGFLYQVSWAIPEIRCASNRVVISLREECYALLASVDCLFA